jgi:CHAD domain-containing protein/uncharacterized protein YjbK
VIEKPMDSSKIEVEAKFIIPDSATFAALQELRHLDDFELRPLGTKPVVDRYLDTAEQRLYRAGLACRLRHVKDKQIITLKSLTEAATEIHRRQEIEEEVESSDFQAGQPLKWPDNEVKKVVVEIISAAPLQPLFTLYQTRYQYQVLWRSRAVIEFSLDEVSLRNPAEVDYYELEAELLEPGSEADLTRFTAALRAVWPLQAETRSKFERALAETTFKDRGRNFMGEQLSNEEKAILGNLANSTNELWAKRALIILMSENGQLSAPEIAGEVGFSPRTVKRWQEAFGEKRLGIFPARALNYQEEIIDQPIEEEETTTETQIATESPETIKMKNEVPSVSENSLAEAYPVRNSIGLEPPDTLAEAGRKVLGFHFARMLQHEPGTRQGDDIEALHDMRVATRRMRAAFRVFGDAFSKKVRESLLTGLKVTGRALGPVRDLDVFIETLQAYQQSLPEDEQTSLQPLLDVWLSEREQARQKMLAYLDSRKYLKFKQYLLKFVTTEGLGAKAIPDGIPVPYQLRHLVPGLIYDRYEAVHAYEVVLDNATIDTLHQLRIAFKQLRYALEFFEEILGDEGEKVIKEVKNLQDHLGNLNDAHVASELLRDFLVKWDQHQLHLPLDQRESPVHLVTYLNTRLADRQRLIVTFPKAWGRFNRPSFRRNLALAISVL